MELEIHGKHAICEIWDADPALLDDPERIRRLMREAAAEARADVRAEAQEKFHPQGLSVALVLAESHLTIHTYPEYGYAAVDCFTCGRDADPLAACRYLVDHLGDGCHATVLYITRPAAGRQIPEVVHLGKGPLHDV